ncbi:hypothetical protein [Cumulibacter manganitolerans]|uniref:hypothetical protein n=1 Tax=Cumulibacter manganitolerans TaxID=1884992 RepID=UPI001295710D|nr:hypothetical protein [Cumulibacter manganitolerans]
MGQEDFHAIFEHTAPQLLQLAYDYVDHDERVDAIWVVSTQEQGVGVTAAFYRIDGRPVHHAEVPLLLPQVSKDDHATFLEELSDLSWAFAEVDDADMPTRMVIRLDVAGDAMEADFSYERVAPVEDEMDDATIMDQWFNRLRDTGNDSATTPL